MKNLFGYFFSRRTKRNISPIEKKLLWNEPIMRTRIEAIFRMNGIFGVILYRENCNPDVLRAFEIKPLNKDELPIDELGFNARTETVLYNNCITHLGELVRLNRREIRKLKGAGIKTVDDIVETLAPLGIYINK